MRRRGYVRCTVGVFQMKHKYNGPYGVGAGMFQREVSDIDGAEVCWCGHENPDIAHAQALMIVDALNNATTISEFMKSEFDTRFANYEDDKL